MIIVENGAGIVNANSYINLDFINNYFLIRSSTWNEKTEQEKELLLIQASEFIDISFNWKGQRKTQNQGLAFPRKNLIDKDGYALDNVPLKIKNAVCKVVEHILEGLNLYNNNQNNAIISETVGSISIQYDTQKSIDKINFNDVDKMLTGLYTKENSKIFISSKVIK